MKFDFIIPARMSSKRLPGKVLKTIAGRSVLDWVYDNCKRSKYCNRIVVGTDDQQIFDYCQARGWEVQMTGQHNCGSNRTAEVASQLNSEWVVEMQGDEPLLWASIIDRWLDVGLVSLKDNPDVDVLISITELETGKVDNPNFVKIAQNANGRLLWGSRVRIPSGFSKINVQYYRQAGLYLWRRESLLRFASVTPGPMEKSEDTHLLRLFEGGFWGQGNLLPETQSIDVPNDIKLAESYILMNAALVEGETRGGAFHGSIK